MPYLYLNNDPSLWFFEGPMADDLSWMQSAEPVTLDVQGPLYGTMILMPSRAGSLAVVGPAPIGGWVPCVTLQVAHLYVPQPEGPTAAAPGYTLSGATDLTALQQNIAAAMRAGSALTVEVSLPPKGLGNAVLNGATLAFAVVCPPHQGRPPVSQGLS
jgi:hypothetical protein